MKKLQLLALSMLFSTSVMMMQASDQSGKLAHVKAKIQDGLNSVQAALQEQLDSVKDAVESSDLSAQAQAKLQDAQAKLQDAQAKLQEAAKNAKDAVAKAVQALPAGVKSVKRAANRTAGQAKDALKKLGAVKRKKSGSNSAQASVNQGSAVQGDALVGDEATLDNV